MKNKLVITFRPDVLLVRIFVMNVVFYGVADSLEFMRTGTISPVATVLSIISVVGLVHCGRRVS